MNRRKQSKSLNCVSRRNQCPRAPRCNRGSYSVMGGIHAIVVPHGSQKKVSCGLPMAILEVCRFLYLRRCGNVLYVTFRYQTKGSGDCTDLLESWQVIKSIISTADLMTLWLYNRRCHGKCEEDRERSPMTLIR